MANFVDQDELHFAVRPGQERLDFDARVHDFISRWDKFQDASVETGNEEYSRRQAISYPSLMRKVHSMKDQPKMAYGDAVDTGALTAASTRAPTAVASPVTVSRTITPPLPLTEPGFSARDFQQNFADYTTDGAEKRVDEASYMRAQPSASEEHMDVNLMKIYEVGQLMVAQNKALQDEVKSTQTRRITHISSGIDSLAAAVRERGRHNELDFVRSATSTANRCRLASNIRHHLRQTDQGDLLGSHSHSHF